jgi:hypothetical protein
MITGIPQSCGHILVFRHHWARGTYRRRCGQLAESDQGYRILCEVLGGCAALVPLVLLCLVARGGRGRIPFYVDEIRFCMNEIQDVDSKVSQRSLKVNSGNILH